MTPTATTTLRVLATVSGIALASAANAQDIRGVTIPLGVYDINNNWLGTYAGTNGFADYAQHPYDGIWYKMDYSSKGIGYNTYNALYYPNTNCAGTSYTPPSDESPELLIFDRKTTLWAPGGSAQQQIVSIQSYFAAGTCYNYSTPQQGIYSAAVAIDTGANRWVPPFTEK